MMHMAISTDLESVTHPVKLNSDEQKIFNTLLSAKNGTVIRESRKADVKQFWQDNQAGKALDPYDYADLTMYLATVKTVNKTKGEMRNACLSGDAVKCEKLINDNSETITHPMALEWEQLILDGGIEGVVRVGHIEEARIEADADQPRDGLLVEHVAAATGQRDSPIVLQTFNLVVGNTAHFIADVPESETAVGRFDLFVNVVDVEEFRTNLFRFIGTLLSQCGYTETGKNEKEEKFFHTQIIELNELSEFGNQHSAATLAYTPGSHPSFSPLSRSIPRLRPLRSTIDRDESSKKCRIGIQTVQRYDFFRIFAI